MASMRFHTGQRISKQAAMVVTLSYASIFPAAAGIQGSAHDFSALGWSGGEICNICHTPHDSSPSAQQPLWNHETSTATYLLYRSPTMKAVAEQPQTGGPSRLCLSCHDGTVAIDSYGGTTGSTTITGRANIGTDLGNHHPVSVKWDHQTQSQGQWSCTECHRQEYNPDTMSYEFVGSAGQELRFFNKMVECPTCHDVHNSQVKDVKLLRMPLAGSQLCMRCHPK